MTDDALKTTIHAAMTQALRDGDKVRLGALRMLTSAIRYKEDEVGHDLSDDEVRGVAAKEVKKRTEAAEAFRAAGRDRLADQEDAEGEVLGVYAPAPLSEQETVALVDEAIASTGADSLQQMGAVMGRIMGTAKGRVDGAAVQDLVRARLEG